ncbi:MAG: GlxA family transcriptional regulator [Paracoccaceae bacterium]|nr:GlxA family transcriptional regulator [Paracoccaceae bacterium]
MPKPEHLVFLLIDEFTHLAFANAVEPLRIANLVSGVELYTWSFASENGESATASNGTTVVVDAGLSNLPASDLLFVVSGINVQSHVTAALKAALRRARSRGFRLGAICSGAYVLAETGLLDGHRAAIHWAYHDALQEKFPEISLARTVFVADDPIPSASGGAAAADLMLHLIGQTHGEDLSLAVSEQMVYTSVRAETAEQKISLQARHGNRSPRLTEAIRIMRNAIEQPPSTAEVAREVGVSTRQLERLFAQHLKTTPKRFLMELRLERSRALLIQTDMSVVEVGLACGFSSPSHFSRVYREAFGISPTNQRRLVV